MADYKQILLNGVATVYSTLASLTRPVVLQFPPGAYNPVTDTTAPGPVSATIMGFIYREENRQGGSSSGYSETLLLQNSDVVAAGLTGNIDEAVKAIVDGVIYEVEFVGYDPVAATVKFGARRG
jgi:hypothetical protein